MWVWRCPARRRRSYHAGHHESRRSYCDAGDSAIRYVYRLDKVIFKGLFIKGIYGREMFETWYKMAALIQSGLDLSPIITHRFSIDDFQKGFDAMRSGQSGKVILSWD